MAKGYIIASVNVTDPAKYEGYKVLSGPAMSANGGRFIVRGGQMAVLEGMWEHPRVVVLEFDSYEKAKAAYDSPEYKKARDARAGAADFNMLVIEGVA
jgi:uncharacterized protein (DUF1330 family)